MHGFMVTTRVGYGEIAPILHIAWTIERAGQLNMHYEMNIFGGFNTSCDAVDEDLACPRKESLN